MPQWQEGGCPAHPIEGCLTLLTKLLQLCCSVCSPGGYANFPLALVMACEATQY